jgi:16S rRNA G966 N2-methylase RsmD
MKGVFIDNDPKLGYETNSIFRKLVNVIYLPLLYFLPVRVIKPLRKINKTADEMVAYAATHRAMEIIYNPNSHPSEGRFRDLFLSIWLKMNNSKAVRNRLRLVKREIKKKIIQLATENKEIRIINIASGSARAVLESTNDISLDQNIKLSAVFIDKNHEAVSFSRRLAETHKYRDNFQWIEDTAANFLRTDGHNSNYNIAEIVGLLEYIADKDMVEIFSAVYRILDSDGILITTNVLNNPERRFMSDAIGWKMIYRSADELSSLLISAGFALDKMKVYFEPQRIHCIIVAQK